MQVSGVSANSEEGCTKIKLRDVLGKMEHNRDLIIAVIFREGSGASAKLLEPEYDQSHVKDQSMKEKDTITLDHCLRAFSREELLTGND